MTVVTFLGGLVVFLNSEGVEAELFTTAAVQPNHSYGRSEAHSATGSSLFVSPLAQLRSRLSIR